MYFASIMWQISFSQPFYVYDLCAKLLQHSDECVLLVSCIFIHTTHSQLLDRSFLHRHFIQTWPPPFSTHGSHHLHCSFPSAKSPVGRNLDSDMPLYPWTWKGGLDNFCPVSSIVSELCVLVPSTTLVAMGENI